MDPLSEALNGAPPEEDGTAAEEIAITAPTMPWTIKLSRATVWFQKLPGGGMGLVLASTVPAPGQNMPIPPGVEFEFDANGWENFKKIVAADGDVPPRVRTATALPPGMKLL